MSTVENKPVVEKTEELKLDFSFNEPVIKAGIATVAVAEELYTENSPLTKEQRKAVQDYEKKFTEDFIKAANSNAVGILLADDSVVDVRTNTKFGIHTYSKLTARSQREVATRNVKTGEVTHAPRASVKLSYGNISKPAVKNCSTEFAELLANG